MFEWSKNAKIKRSLDKFAELDNILDALSLDNVDRDVFRVLALESSEKDFAPFFTSYNTINSSLDRSGSMEVDRRAVLRSLENLAHLGYITYQVEEEFFFESLYKIDIIGSRVSQDYEASFQTQPAKVQEVVLESTNPNVGGVYLLRVGQYFKIGKTTNLKDRLTKLAIQLPQKPELVHSMNTDNIHWLEKHWHRYFSSKRVNGEWFELDEADVSEFCAISNVEISIQ